MPRRRRPNILVPLRSALSNAVLAVEERVIWRGGDILRAVADVVKWPFERIAWAVERRLIWPLAERTGDWSGPLRATGAAALALLAVGAGVLGLAWASSSGGTAARQAEPVVATESAVLSPAPQKKPAPTAPVLQGAAPDFTPKAGGSAKPADDTVTEGSKTTTPTSSDTAAADPSSRSDTSSSSSAAKAEPAGPAATKVAHRFSTAFVLYETGRSDAKVRTAFAATATPQLARSLLRRPPRLPANVKVPKAKVLNVVPGPQHGDTYTLSVSLLRVGITSELRLDMQRDEDAGKWQVTDVLG